MSSPNTKPARLARLSLAAIALLVAGCQDYAVRRDTIAFHAGEAIAFNKAVHIIDPWPAVGARTNIPMDGPRAVRAIERYETGAGAGLVVNGSPGMGSPLAAPAPTPSP